MGIFEKMEEGLQAFASKNVYTSFFINLLNKNRIKIMHQKTRKHYAVHPRPLTSEDRVNMDLFPGKQ
jgi:hypothetical protein